MRTLLTSTASDRVRAVKALARRSVRRRTGTFLAEGANCVRAALDYAPERCDELFVVDPQAHIHEVAAAEAAGVPITPVTPAVMRAMADAETPADVLLVCRRVDLSLDALMATQPRALMVLLHVRDPGNLGTVIRTADACGLDGVIISTDSVDVYNPKTVRSTAGSLFHVPVCTEQPAAELLETLRRAGVRTIATDPHGGDDVRGAATQHSHAWVFGNEAWGLPPEYLHACAERRTIPVAGRAESLNLAMAATLCAWTSSEPPATSTEGHEPSQG